MPNMFTIHNILFTVSITVSPLSPMSSSSASSSALAYSLVCMISIHWEHTSPLFMEGVHLIARLTDQKMLMIGGGSGDWGDEWPHLLEMARLKFGDRAFFFTVLLVVSCFELQLPNPTLLL